MKVKDLKAELENYNDDAEVVVIDWSTGNTFDATVDGDDEDEGEAYCRIGI